MATRSSRHTPRDASTRRLWVYVAIAVFIVGDLALAAWALSPSRVNAEGKTAGPIPTYNATTPTPTPTVPAAVPVTSVPPTRILAALDGTTAWRALTGDCPATAATPELSTDSGATWTPTDATGPTGVHALQRIAVSDETTASMVGLDEDCTPTIIKTFIAGDNYKAYPDELANAWYVDPADRATVHSPDGDVVAPCASVIALAPSDADNAAVLCADQTVFTTTDAGGTWSGPVSVPGAINLSAGEAGYLIAAVGLPECAGVHLIALDSELAQTTLGCFPSEASADSLPGNVALAAAEDTIWLWVGDTVARLSDGATTWQ